MKPFDCHNHLYDEKFDADRDKVIEQARKVLSGIVVVGENPETNRKILELKKKYPNFIFAGYGIHPTYAHEFSDKEIEDEIKWIKKQKPACIGEVGLDMFWVKMKLPKDIGIKKADEAWEKQKKVFEKFIQLADELKIPLNVHSRWATKQVIEILEKNKAKKVILHSFSGSLAEAKRAADLGYLISIGNTITFREEKRKIAEHLDLKYLLLETDSPALAAKQGERNQPKNISLVVKEIARIKKISEQEVIEITNENFKEMFGI
ncbi:MAG: TatD family hydrolase [archaeon]